MNDVVKWLESPEGEKWSRAQHKQTANQIILMQAKDSDCPCTGCNVRLWDAFFRTHGVRDAT